MLFRQSSAAATFHTNLNNKKEKIMKLTGVMPALVTPFDENNNVDFNAFEKLLTNLRAAGVSGWVQRLQP